MRSPNWKFTGFPSYFKFPKNKKRDRYWQEFQHLLFESTAIMPRYNALRHPKNTVVPPRPVSNEVSRTPSRGITVADRWGTEDPWREITGRASMKALTNKKAVSGHRTCLMWVTKGKWASQINSHLLSPSLSRNFKDWHALVFRGALQNCLTCFASENVNAEVFFLHLNCCSNNQCLFSS